MGRFSCRITDIAESISVRTVKNDGNSNKKKKKSSGGGREAAEAMVKEAKKNERILTRSSGSVHVFGSTNFASVFSRRGEKGINQDCFIVWEEYGCQEDMMFCGVFDGHGPWGHFVAKRVRETLPSTLLCNWQEAIAKAASADPNSHNLGMDHKKKLNNGFNLWKHSYLRTCAAVDHDLQHHRRIDSFYSGTTALTIVKQGEVIVVANVGDSRAVLATTSDDGRLIPVQLTIDFKPNLPQEAERIRECKGRVFSLEDEVGVERVWLPNEDCPGLAMSRALGDHCVKDFGLISVPEVTQRHISSRDQFVVMATDGVWDVITNEEAVQIVSSAPDRAKAAKRLVESAVRAWKRKRRGIAVDDISAICLFFHTSPSSSHHIIHPPLTSTKLL